MLLFLFASDKPEAAQIKPQHNIQTQDLHLDDDSSDDDNPRLFPILLKANGIAYKPAQPKQETSVEKP